MRAYARYQTKSEQVASLMQADLTPLEVAQAVFGQSLTKEDFDLTLDLLEENGVSVKPSYAEQLWSSK